MEYGRRGDNRAQLPSVRKRTRGQKPAKATQPELVAGPALGKGAAQPLLSSAKGVEAKPAKIRAVDDKADSSKAPNTNLKKNGGATSLALAKHQAERKQKEKQKSTKLADFLQSL